MMSDAFLTCLIQLFVSDFHSLSCQSSLSMIGNILIHADPEKQKERKARVTKHTMPRSS